MSMIYDALRCDQDTSPKAKWTRARIGTFQRISPYALWLVTGVLLAGPAGYLIARTVQPASDSRATPPPTDVTAAMPSAPSSAIPPESAAGHAIATADLPGNVVPTVPHSPTTADTFPVISMATIIDKTNTRSVKDAGDLQRPVTPAPAPVVAANTGNGSAVVPVFSIQVDNPPATHKRAPTFPASSEEPDPAAVRGHMGKLHSAVAAGDSIASEQTLRELQSLLPAHSLTLLRARAWAAHGSGDAEMAEQHYAAILARVPDDEHAGVNLALLEARRGADGEARARLNRLAARNSRSAVVNQALQELEKGSL